MSINTTQGLSAAPIGASTPKDWDELNDAEKIERLREIIKYQTNNLSRYQSDIHYLREQFKEHSHGEKGVTVPFNEYNNLGLLGSASLTNQKYI